MEEFILAEVLKKRELSGFDESLARSILKSHLLRDAKRLDKISKSSNPERSKEFKEIVKAVRKDIGDVYGAFLGANFSSEIQRISRGEMLLSAHKSSRERMLYYKEVYSKILEWHMPKKIADLGSGLNPLTYELLDGVSDFFFTDLNINDLMALSCFLEKKEIRHSYMQGNLLDDKIFFTEGFLSSDMIFLFKVLDSLEKFKRNRSKEILEMIPQRYVVVSFPSKSLCLGLKIRANRGWFFGFLERSKWKFESFEIGAEMYIMIDKGLGE